MMPARRRIALPLLSLLAAAAPVATGTGALAADPPAPRRADVVEVVNETPFTILHLYAHAEGAADWTEDWLGDKLIEPGKSMKLDFDAGPGHCLFDVKIEFIDADPVNFTRFDACRETVLRVDKTG